MFPLFISPHGNSGGNSGDTILNSVTVTVTKPVSAFGHGDVLKPKEVKHELLVSCPAPLHPVLRQSPGSSCGNPRALLRRPAITNSRMKAFRHIVCCIFTRDA